MESTHAAHRVPFDVYRRQRMLAATLGRYQLQHWLQRTPVIDARVQKMLLTTHRPHHSSSRIILIEHPSLLPENQVKLLEEANEWMLSRFSNSRAPSDEALEFLLKRKLKIAIITNLLCNPGVTRHWRDRFFGRLSGENKEMAKDAARDVLVYAKHLEPDEVPVYTRWYPQKDAFIPLSSPALSPEERRQAIASDDNSVLNAFASNPSLTEAEQLKLLARRPNLAGVIASQSLNLSAVVRKKVIESGEFGSIENLLRFHGSKITDGEIIKMLEASKHSGDDGAQVKRFILRLDRELPRDLVLSLYKNYLEDKISNRVLARPELPLYFIEQEARQCTDRNALRAVLRNPRLNVDSSYPLRLLLLGEENKMNVGAAYKNWDDDSTRGRLNASKVLRKIRDQIRPDFWDMFASSWEGTGDEFIEYAHALDA